MASSEQWDIAFMKRHFGGAIKRWVETLERMAADRGVSVTPFSHHGAETNEQDGALYLTKEAHHALARHLIELCVAMSPSRGGNPPCYITTPENNREGEEENHLELLQALFPGLDLEEDVNWVDPFEAYEAGLNQERINIDALRDTNCFQMFGGCEYLRAALYGLNAETDYRIVNPDAFEYTTRDPPDVCEHAVEFNEDLTVLIFKLNRSWLLFALKGSSVGEDFVPVYAPDMGKLPGYEMTLVYDEDVLKMVEKEEFYDDQVDMTTDVAFVDFTLLPLDAEETKEIDMATVDRWDTMIKAMVKSHPATENLQKRYRIYLMTPAGKIGLVIIGDDELPQVEIAEVMRAVWATNKGMFTSLFGPPSLFSGYVVIKK